MRFPQLFNRNGPPGGARGAAADPAESPVVGTTPSALPAEPPSSATAALDEARRLVAEGDLVAAVDRLVAANTESRDADVELALQTLRYDAAAAFEAGPGRADWPPAHPDPFPEVVGRPPEIARADLDPEVLGGAVAHHGGLIVRGAFDDEQVARSIAAIDRARAGSATAPAPAAEEDADGEPWEGDEWYRPLDVFPWMKNRINRRMVAEQGGIWLGDSPAAAHQVLADLQAAGIVGAIASHFGERPFFSLQKSTLRRSAAEYRLAAWHQDGSFLTPGVRTMNAWVALTRCGGDHPAPGLEIVPRRVEEILPVDAVLSPHSISFDLVAELAAQMPTMVPEFAPGDAFLFDERLVHRTHLTEAVTELRYAIECWFFAPSHHSTSYSPLLV